MSTVGNTSSSIRDRETVIEQFLAWYEERRSDYVSIAQESAGRLAQALSDAGVPHKVEYRAKGIDRLRIKVNGRKKDTEYGNVDDVVTDIVDLAGVRVLLYFPSDKDRVEKIITENFEVHSSHRLTGTETTENGEASHRYTPKYPGYCADHYRATLRLEKGRETEPWKNFRLEIQVTTILRHTWAEVGHDWSYKKLKPGGEDEFCCQLLDALSGAVDMGEFFLEQMQQRLMTQKEQADQPFRSHYDLGKYLTDWAARNDRTQNLVDVQTLWEVLNRFDYHRPTRLSQILAGLDLSSELAQKYEPLPLNIETSIIHSIMESDERYKRERDTDAADPTKFQRHKLKVVRDCFIWFGRLFRFNHKWFSLLCSGNVPKRVVENMEWLVNQSMKGGEPLSSGDERILDDLFDTFARHGQLAVQYVFFLARLRVKGFTADGYAMRMVVQPLLKRRAHQKARLY
jgi:ppGpp synthetase/RelA/SpoT-type nucleotidyltranferase